MSFTQAARIAGGYKADTAGNASNAGNQVQLGVKKIGDTLKGMTKKVLEDKQKVTKVDLEEMRNELDALKECELKRNGYSGVLSGAFVAGTEVEIFSIKGSKKQEPDSENVEEKKAVREGALSEMAAYNNQIETALKTMRRVSEPIYQIQADIIDAMMKILKAYASGGVSSVKGKVEDEIELLLLSLPKTIVDAQKLINAIKFYPNEFITGVSKITHMMSMEQLVGNQTIGQYGTQLVETETKKIISKMFEKHDHSYNSVFDILMSVAADLDRIDTQIVFAVINQLLNYQKKNYSVTNAQEAVWALGTLPSVKPNSWDKRDECRYMAWALVADCFYVRTFIDNLVVG